MIKIKNIFLVIISFLMIAVGCAKIDGAYHSTSIPTNDRGEYAILFNNSSVVTKAAVTTTAGNGYDEFSLYAWNSSNDTIMNPYKIVATGQGSYGYDKDVVDGQKLQYFKNSADSYSFIGVIPTTDVKVKNGAVKVGVESFVIDDNRVSGTLTADSPKEFLWARANVAKGNYNQSVNLPFKHGNALLYLGFISDAANTQIIDYTHYTPAQPAQDAWDETVDVTTYQTTTKPTPMLGPVIGTITDEDIDYINSKYTSSLGWLDYYSSNSTFTGSLDENMWEYLVSKHPELTSEDLEGWGTYANNSNMRLVHVDKNGHKSTDGDSYRGWFVNVQNVNFNNPTTTTTRVHHDAVPAVPASGFKGIRVFSAKADATDGYAHLAHTKNADATVATGLTFDNRVTVTGSIQFSLPANTIIPVYTGDNEDTAAQKAVYSPTTFYAIPGDAGLTHFVVKLSYTYKGTTVYDVRVPITLPAAGLEAGKYYKYIINITSIANGTNDLDEANNEKNDIDIVDNPIQVTTTITDYENGDSQIITI